jgi:hypothetical protein
MNKYIFEDSTKAKTQPAVVLVLGSNPFQKKGFKNDSLENSYEIINLKYLPSLCQVNSLNPEIVIVNFHGQKDESLKHLINLCKEIKEEHGAAIPLIGITAEALKKQLNESDFDKLWNTSIDPNCIFDEIADLINSSKSQRDLWNTLAELEDFKKTVHKEMEQASIFQGALFNKAIARTNLKTAYHYLFQKEIGGDFFRLFDLSASHVGILIGDVRGRGAGAALLTGFILGELYVMSSEKQRVLWSPSQLLARLSESIYSHNQMSELCSSAWYGVLDVTTGELEYSRAGHTLPLFLNAEEKEVYSLDGGSGFPMGIFPGMTYRSHLIKLPFNSRLLLFTDGLTNQKDSNNEQLNPKWLEDCFKQTFLQKKPLRDVPAIIDSTFTDLCKGTDSTDDRIMLCCELSSMNQAYVQVLPKKIEETDSLLSKIAQDAPAEVLDLILSSLPKDLPADVFSEFEIALEELINKACAQIQKTYLISSAEHDEEHCTTEGFNVSWWIHEDRMDISISLDQGSIPWSYPLNCQTSNEIPLDSACSVVLFFDNIQVNKSGLELSMSKELA